MNRTDRLYAIVEELRARSPRRMGARDLATRFEVSPRTIERDLLALQEAGVPIWSQRGPGGGYALDPRRTLPPLNLTAEEAAALAMAVAAARGMPFGRAGERARRKLAAVLAPGDADGARAIADRVRISRADDVDQGVIRRVEDAVSKGLCVDLRYVDRHGDVTDRRVEAHGLHGGRGGWYLVGWCRLRDDGRVFRLDRIREAELTDEPIPERSLDEVLDVPFPVDRPVLAE